MIAYVIVGTDDNTRAKLFYVAFLTALGYGLPTQPQGNRASETLNECSEEIMAPTRFLEFTPV
jgi:hypothetical protein